MNRGSRYVNYFHPNTFTRHKNVKERKLALVKNH